MFKLSPGVASLALVGISSVTRLFSDELQVLLLCVHRLAPGGIFEGSEASSAGTCP